MSHVKQETSALWRAPGVDGFRLYSLHHPGTYASRPPTQEWKRPRDQTTSLQSFLSTAAQDVLNGSGVFTPTVSQT